MTPDEIRIEFIKQRKKTNMAEIGRQLGVSQPAVQRVVDRNSVSERIMAAVAKAIGYPKEQVFPEHQFKS